MLQDVVEADSESPGGSCPIGALIAGRVPSQSSTVVPLEPDDREYVACACTDGSPVVASKLHRALLSAGYKVGYQSISKHRRRSCECFLRG